MHSSRQGGTQTCVRRQTGRVIIVMVIASRQQEPGLDRKRAACCWTGRSQETPQGDQFISTQHAKRLKAVRSKDESVPGMLEMIKLIEEKEIKKTGEPTASAMTLSKKNAAVAAARPKRHGHRGQPQLHRNQGYDFEQHSEARSRMCHRIHGRERVDSVEALQTPFCRSRQRLPPVVSLRRHAFWMRARNSTMEFSVGCGTDDRQVSVGRRNKNWCRARRPRRR